MRVFVTGATGFVGSAVTRELLDAGHEVVGLARSDRSAEALKAAGAEVHRGDLTDLDSLRRGAEAADGVAHLAFIHDFTNLTASGEADLEAVRAIGEVLEGSGKPFVVTSGLLTAPGRLGTEEDPADPDSPAKHRHASESATLALAERGVRSSVLRLPPSVHGEGDAGFVPMFIDFAREKGVSGMVGDGSNRWAAVHRLDAARLFRLALEAAPAGVRLHAIGDEGVPFREIAETIGRGLDVPVVNVAPEEATDHFGWLGRFAAIDMRASGARTQKLLGWRPEHSALIPDLEAGHYFKTD
ncbi:MULTISPECIES: SDR family oxidoreductase [unclassified Streptomyces]|jgi:nucleoside-diphosphate-sugar epimerase|uniref:SDR family oxidoreductase n=1 Tax=unclassified Streptomyces TaxID=2593676 RepID=UPI001BAE8FEB|nr:MULTISPECIES: SDR family oxidoreductase [unclassified Streptomyces]MDH6450397.1 nucleoside-diphosphate-sugar epimerase [Streptomyces sp. SAI-119]MDH6499059.1 nucleoside-diphosphate-sugar epimerase [Streptomyces sp. SAI-149]QUC62181.1 SDR family oxidoreductase [Streptomyces sp. A2-16]